jgi:hypothetical protein
MLRRRRPSADPLAHIDPAATSPRFAGAVAEALDVRRRFADVTAGVREGPTRDRLLAAAARLDAGVAAVWDVAQRATSIERTLATLDPERVADDYKRARRTGASPELEQALAQRFASVQRLLNTLDDTDERLRLLDARLGAAVAGAAEVALGAAGAADSTLLDSELDAAAQELDAMRAALDELR